MKLLLLTVALGIFFLLFSGSLSSALAQTNNAWAKEIVVPSDKTINGDYNALGDDVRIYGKITGSARILAKKVYVSGSIGGDLMVSGGDVTLEGATIGGQVHALGGNVTSDENTKISGDIKAGGKNVDIKSETNGAKLWGRESLNVGKNVNGDVKAAEGPFISEIFQQIGTGLKQIFNSIWEIIKTGVDKPITV